MIHFFRKIRQRVLSENQTSKYLLYALGEILLVVVGILIALQINNWNTQRSDRLTVKNYLNKIAQDVRSDLKAAEALMTFKHEHSLICTKARRLLAANDFSDQKTINDAIIGVFFEEPLDYNRDAYESFKNSTFYQCLSDDYIESLLNAYYKAYNEILWQESVQMQWIHSMENEMVKQGFTAKWMQINKFPDDNVDNLHPLYSQELTQLKEHNIILDALLRGASGPLYIQDLYTDQLKYGNELLQAIKALD